MLFLHMINFCVIIVVMLSFKFRIVDRKILKARTIRSVSDSCFARGYRLKGVTSIWLSNGTSPNLLYKL
jgi:hypothetical protein